MACEKTIANSALLDTLHSNTVWRQYRFNETVKYCFLAGFIVITANALSW